jgi:DNA-binding NarL/FixJ family response regulator
MINVLIVDDQNFTHRLIETYLKSEQEIKIVGFAKNGQEAIEQIPTLQPDIVLMDLEMPTMDGLAATKIITQQFASTKVLILTVHDNERHLSKALKNGAKGYLLKNTMGQELKNAICNAYQGYFQLSLELIEKYIQKIITLQPESEKVLNLTKKVDYLYKFLNKLENKLETIYLNNSEANLETQITAVLQKEMASFSDRDSNLQFRVDRMKYDQERLQRNAQFLFKTQLVCTVVVLLGVVYLIFSNVQ